MSDAINKPAHYNQGPIECIDAMQQILTPEEFRGFLKGNVFKYLWREKGKNGIEDLRKGKDYYDRLIQSFDESEAEQLATGEVTGEGTGEVKPPDGWRWLEVGEKFFLGDTTVNSDGTPHMKTSISKQYCESWKCQISKTFIRRNRFEVGEKVVECVNNRIGVVKDIEAIGSGKNFLYHVEMQDAKGMILFSPHQLAPYIEEAK